jgi:hypothetical protein
MPTMADAPQRSSRGHPSGGGSSRHGGMASSRSRGGSSEADTEVSPEGTFVMPGAPPDPPRGRRAAGAAARRAASVGTAATAPQVPGRSAMYISNRAYGSSSHQRLAAPADAPPASPGPSGAVAAPSGSGQQQAVEPTQRQQ